MIYRHARLLLKKLMGTVCQALRKSRGVAAWEVNSHRFCQQHNTLRKRHREQQEEASFNSSLSEVFQKLHILYYHTAFPLQPFVFEAFDQLQVESFVGSSDLRQRKVQPRQQPSVLFEATQVPWRRFLLICLKSRQLHLIWILPQSASGLDAACTWFISGPSFFGFLVDKNQNKRI